MNIQNNADGVWKSGKGKGRRTPKGRQYDDAALAEVRALLGGNPAAGVPATDVLPAGSTDAEATVDFDTSRAATIDVDRAPLKCQACDTFFFVDPDTRVRDVVCPRCSVPIGSGANQRDQRTGRPGSEPTVDVTPGRGGDAPADSSAMLRITAIGERYAKLGLHAVGGLGEVYLARDEQLDRQVALKEMQERHADASEKRERFLLEGCVTGRLEHPGIVPVYSLGADSAGRPFYTMRFIRGRSLNKAIKLMHRREDLQIHPSDSSLRSVLQSFIATCHAIEYAHSRGVLHCDLKPDNIMVGKFGETYVVDWGMARVEGDALVSYQNDGETPLRLWRSVTQGRQGSAMGTPAYMSPEQACGDWKRLKEAGDVFSLGATLYQILTGVPPYMGESVTEVLNLAAAGTFPSPREVAPRIPRPLEAICLKAMAERPEHRYSSAQQLAEEVDRWLGDEPLLACPDSPWDRVRRYARRNRALVLSGVAAVAMIAIVSTVSAVAVNRARLEQQRLAKHNELLAASEAEAHVEAEQRFQQARETVDVWLTGFSEALRQYPGMVNLRLTMLHRAADQYERFADQGLDEPDLQEERARTLARLGNLRRELGETTAAVEAYRSALTTLDGIIASGDAPPSTTIERARTLDRLGLALRDQGDLTAAQAALQTAVDELVVLVDADGESSPDALNALATARLNLASLSTALEQFSAAASEYQAVVDFVRQSPRAPAATRELQEAAATAHNGLGEVALVQGDARLAERHFTRAVAMFENLFAETQNDPAVREQLGAARLALSGALAAQGDLRGQADALKLAADDFSWLTAVFPDVVKHRENLAKVRTNHGQLLVELGQIDDARVLLESAIAAQRELVADYPLNMDYVRDYAVSVDNLAHAHLLGGAFAEALAAADEAARVLSELAAAAPSLAGLRERLAVVESHRAQAAWDFGSHDRALEHFQAASEIVEAVSASTNDEVAAFLPNLATIESRHGWARQWQGDADDAHVHFDRAAALWRKWSEQSTDGRAAGQGAIFFATAPDPDARDAQASLVLAVKARQASPGSRMLAAIMALARCELGETEAASNEIAQLLPGGAPVAPVADRDDAALRFAAAYVEFQRGNRELAQQYLQAASDWTAATLPGDWGLRAIELLVRQQVAPMAVTQDETPPAAEKVDSDADYADSDDSGE